MIEKIKTGSDCVVYTGTTLVSDDVNAYQIVHEFGHKAVGGSCKITAKRADGQIIQDVTSITDDGTVNYLLPSNMYACHGELKLRLQVMKEDTIITKSTLYFKVEKGDKKTLDPETEVPFLDAILKKIQEAEKQLNNKVDRTEVNSRFSLKADKSDIANVYKFKGSIDTVAELPFKWAFIPNGVPTIDGEPCGTYDEKTNTVTLNEEYYDGEVIFPIKPIILKETSSYYFCNRLTPGIGYIGDNLFHIYDCADGYGESYQTLTKGTVIDKVIVEECYSIQTNYLGALYKGYKTWYNGDDYDEDGILDTEYPSIPYDVFTNGAVYNVIENGMDYGWTGEGWNALGGEHKDLEAREMIEELYSKLAKIEKILGTEADKVE